MIETRKLRECPNCGGTRISTREDHDSHILRCRDCHEQWREYDKQIENDD
jgi:ribosomal protein L37AE/L43A